MAAREATSQEILSGEPPEIMSRNLVSAGYLLAGATAFFFLAFLFAFFYLRALNNGHLWKPKDVDPSVAWGTVVVACYVVSAGLVRVGLADELADRQAAWRLKGLAALLAGVAGLVLQAVAWTQQGFGPADGGFASVYFGWTAFLFLFVLGAMFWLETTVATSYRYRNDLPEGDHDIANPISLVRGALGALSFYWSFLAGIAILTWVVLYLI